MDRVSRWDLFRRKYRGSGNGVVQNEQKLKRQELLLPFFNDYSQYFRTMYCISSNFFSISCAKIKCAFALAKFWSG